MSRLLYYVNETRQLHYNNTLFQKFGCTVNLISAVERREVVLSSFLLGHL